MAGLTSALMPLVLSCLPQQQQVDDVNAVHAARVEQLLATDGTDLYFRNTLFQSITRLEHSHSALVLRAWHRLNIPPNDTSISNIILFSRRNQIDLPEISELESSDSTLERSLYLWGSMSFAACQNLLQDSAAAYPDDLRFQNNLTWLTFEQPKMLPADCAQRELCQAVLAFKSPLH